jgi:hypothetical protein
MLIALKTLFMYILNDAQPFLLKKTTNSNQISSLSGNWIRFVQGHVDLAGVPQSNLRECQFPYLPRAAYWGHGSTGLSMDFPRVPESRCLATSWISNQGRWWQYWNLLFFAFLEVFSSCTSDKQHLFQERNWEERTESLPFSSLGPH